MISSGIFIILVLLVYLIARGSYICFTFKKVKVQWIKEIIRVLFVIYIFIVISVTLFPIRIWGGLQLDMENLIRSINLIPLKSIISNLELIGVAYGGDVQFMIGLIIKNVGGNILLFMPLGFLAPIIWDKFKYFSNAFLLGFTASISVELIQLVITLVGGGGRITVIDDLICNVIGTSIGFYVYKLFFKYIVNSSIKLTQKTE